MLVSPWVPPAVLNTNFKILHRRVFTSVILHQINRRLYDRKCAVCGVEDEDFDHFFFSCTETVVFQDWVRGLVMLKCRGKGLMGEQWDWVWCFGILSKLRGCNVRLINFILVLARHVLLRGGNLGNLARNCEVEQMMGRSTDLFESRDGGQTAKLVGERAMQVEPKPCPSDGRGSNHSWD